MIPSKNTFIHFAAPSHDELLELDLEDDTQLFVGDFRRNQSEPAPSPHRRHFSSDASRLVVSPAQKLCHEKKESDDDESTTTDDASSDLEVDVQHFHRQETEFCWPTHCPSASNTATVCQT